MVEYRFFDEPRIHATARFRCYISTGFVLCALGEKEFIQKMCIRDSISYSLSNSSSIPVQNSIASKANPGTVK